MTTWSKLEPYENVYDEQQGTDDFTNCAFDPWTMETTKTATSTRSIPAGNTGRRRLAFRSSSSRGRVTRTTATWRRSGGTSASPTRTPDCRVRSTWGPGSGHDTLPRSLRGAADQAPLPVHVDRAGDRGRRGRIPSLQPRRRGHRDDGWYIDDVEISNALTSPATVSSDTRSEHRLSPRARAPAGR